MDNNLDMIVELLQKISSDLNELTKITKEREARFAERSKNPSGGNRDGGGFRRDREKSSFGSDRGGDRRKSSWDDKKDFEKRRNNK